ncbi:Uncharacterised protein [Mycobacterium tuberculosis]|nr:Uncharacterised protein [Mycobacterium tuberculosis]CKS05313.1 Uncharacterised protein [Mycobacterium tuberculosis]CKS55137.1 Uncharacterised protein [Mycobacterium tuberculosis]CKS79243.1 Uncharacterised protein [Mycobacterium tuberculosis]CKU29488.1 Uncharacterised protein [Mycobacterium tuberculosis]
MSKMFMLLPLERGSSGVRACEMVMPPSAPWATQYPAPVISRATTDTSVITPRDSRLRIRDG